MNNTKDDSSEKGERSIQQLEGEYKKSQGGKCQMRSCLVPVCQSLMNGLWCEGNTNLAVTLSTIYRGDNEKRQWDGGRTHAFSDSVTALS